MKYIKLSAIALIAFVLIASIFFYNKDEIKIKCICPSVCIYNPDFGSTGSGVVVRSEKFDEYYYNVAITCEHIMGEDDRINSTGYIVKIPIFKQNKIINYDEYPCVIYEKNKEYDLAIVIFFSNQKLECADIDFNCKLDINDKILKVGYGLGDDLRMDHGIITSISGKLDENKNLYRMNAFSIFGDSGGPVFHNNKLIGITKGIRTIGQNPIFFMSFASSIKNLKIWQKELNNIEFAYDKSKKLPVIPAYFLDFSTWSLR